MIIQALKALSEEHRLHILASCSQQEVYTCQIVHASGMSQSTVSNHIKILKAAGLLNVNKQKTWSGYYLNPAMPDDIMEIVKTVLSAMYKDPRWQAFHEKILDSGLNGPCEEGKET